MKSPKVTQTMTKICPKCGKEYPKKTISCEDCNITLMKKTTYGRLVNDRSLMLLICPNCKKRFYPPVNTKVCDNCKTTLITNDEYVQHQNNFSKKFNTVLFLFFAIGAVAIIWFFATILSSPAPNHTYTCSRCGTTFTDSANKKSIAYSGYCKKCHDDVEFILDVSEALENQ